MTKTTKTEYYVGGRVTERPSAIVVSVHQMEAKGWRVQDIIMGMGGMWVVYERDQK